MVRTARAMEWVSMLACNDSCSGRCERAACVRSTTRVAAGFGGAALCRNVILENVSLNVGFRDANRD